MNLETYFKEVIIEDNKLYMHNSEGSDDMPAHIKSSIIGQSLLIPITNKSLNNNDFEIT